MDLLENNFIKNLVLNNEFIDARFGGLILGNSHIDGGINFVFETPEGYRLMGEIEGDEYILSNQATIDNQNRLMEINNRERDFNEKIIDSSLDKSIRIIDARINFRRSKYILLQPNISIINKYSTQKFIEELNLINNQSFIKTPIEKHLCKFGKTLFENLSLSAK